MSLVTSTPALNFQPFLKPRQVFCAAAVTSAASSQNARPIFPYLPQLLISPEVEVLSNGAIVHVLRLPKCKNPKNLFVFYNFFSAF